MTAHPSPTDRLLACSREQQLPEFLSMTAECEALQSEVLLDIVARARQTEWGRGQRFDAIATVDDFRRTQPVTDWADVEPYGERMQAGECDLIFPGQADMFVLTSGTTGASKLIPESRAAAEAKRATQELRIVAVLPHVPTLADEGAILTFANRRTFGHTPGGIPFGPASGANLAQSPPLGPERLAYPLWVPEVADGEADVDYLILRFALERDVRAIRGNNAGRLASLLRFADAHRDALIDDIRTGVVRSEIDPQRLAAEGIEPNPARADELAAAVAERGRLDAASAWPHLEALVFWLSGSVGRFMADLDGLVPESAIHWDLGYGSSEGRFNIPLAPAVSSGPLALHAHFYEFVPTDGGEPLLAHEVDDGGTYGLLVTSYSGLYRYDMHDLVRIDGFTGSTPNIVFEAKTGDVANIAGEKLPGSGLLRELDGMLGSAGVRARHFCIVTDLDRHAYELCLELADPDDPDDAVPADLAVRFESALSATSIAYDLFKGQGMLAAPRVHLMRVGWQEALYQAQLAPGRSRSQVKLPLVVAAVPSPEFIESTLTTG